METIIDNMTLKVSFVIVSFNHGSSSRPILNPREPSLCLLCEVKHDALLLLLLKPVLPPKNFKLLLTSLSVFPIKVINQKK